MSHTQGHKSLSEVKSHDRKYQPPFFIKQTPIRFSSEHAIGISQKYEYVIIQASCLVVWSEFRLCWFVNELYDRGEPIDSWL